MTGAGGPDLPRVEVAAGRLAGRTVMFPPVTHDAPPAATSTAAPALPHPPPSRPPPSPPPPPSCPGRPAGGLVGYLAELSAGRYVLWCYFIYWVVITVRYFDPRPQIWLTSLGLSGIIGFALYVNTTRSGRERVRLGGWPTFRLFLTPFCVSSFAALVKDRGFVLIFSPVWWETAAALALCGLLGAAAVAARSRRARAAGGPAAE